MQHKNTALLFPFSQDKGYDRLFMTCYCRTVANLEKLLHCEGSYDTAGLLIFKQIRFFFGFFYIPEIHSCSFTMVYKYFKEPITNAHNYSTPMSSLDDSRIVKMQLRAIIMCHVSTKC